MIGMGSDLSRDRLIRLGDTIPVSGARHARGLRVSRRRAPRLSGGRLRTGGIHTRFLSPVSFDTSDFSVRRAPAAAVAAETPKITFPTAGVAKAGAPLGSQLRRPVA